MARTQIRGLISATQELVKPSDQLPPMAPTSPAESMFDWRARVVVPPDWTRPLPPEDIPPVDEIRVAIEQEDEVTIETDRESGGRLPLGEAAAPAVAPVFDTLAYYLPFHFYLKRWGIYVKASGVLELTRCIVGRNYLYKHERWIVGFAARCLFLHEFFHHSTEVACSRLEYPIAPLWENSGKDVYSSYFADRCGGSVEEALANANVARSIGRYFRNVPNPKSYDLAKQGLLKAMDDQPPPYREFRRFLANGPHACGRDHLIDRMYRPWLHGPKLSAILGSGLYFSDITPDAADCPTYLVPDVAMIRVAKPFRKGDGIQVFVHSNDHRPAHVHVEDLGGRNNFRYLWPSLAPYSQDERLPARLESVLREIYVPRHRSAIEKRIKATYPGAFP